MGQRINLIMKSQMPYSVLKLANSRAAMCLGKPLVHAGRVI